MEPTGAVGISPEGQKGREPGRFPAQVASCRGQQDGQAEGRGCVFPLHGGEDTAIEIAEQMLSSSVKSLSSAGQ